MGETAGVKKAALVFLAVFILLLPFFLLPGVGFWVYQELPARLGAQVEGRFRPAFTAPSFSVRDVRLDWRDKIKVSSGTIRVEYNMVALLQTGKLHIRLSGEGLPVTFQGEWAGRGMVEKTTFDFFKGEFVLGKQGLEEIKMIRAKSPEVEFKMDRTLPAAGDRI